MPQTVHVLETVDTLRSAHGGLDGHALHLLPVLGEERHGVVEGEGDVSLNVSRGHVDVGDGNSHTQGLLGLELELDGGTSFKDLLRNVIGRVQNGRELTRLVETRAYQTRNLTNQTGGGQESRVALSQLLDELLVLLQEGKVLLGHGRHVELLGFVTMLHITNDGNDELLTRDMREDNNTGKTLFLVSIVVLQGNLEFDGLGEFALLVGRTLKNSGDRIRQ